MVFILILFISSFSPLRVEKVSVFTLILLNKHKLLIGNELLLLYDILITNTNFLDKLCNLLVILNFPEM